MIQICFSQEMFAFFTLGKTGQLKEKMAISRRCSDNEGKKKWQLHCELHDEMGLCLCVFVPLYIQCLA
jgi:hypothetical protein